MFLFSDSQVQHFDHPHLPLLASSPDKAQVLMYNKSAISVHRTVPDTRHLYKVYVTLPPHGRDAVLPPQLDTEVKVMWRVPTAGDTQLQP